ncbi:MAG: hypothetical protein ACJ8MH_19645 [Povalibacter sp.]
MQRVTLVRYTTKPGRAADNEALAKSVFEPLRDEPSQGIGYAVLRNDSEFIHLFVNLKADDASAVTELPAFKVFEKDLAERCDGPPTVMRVAADLVDAYGFCRGALA